MITFDELNTQNHKIMELSKVLQNVIHDRLLCDNNVTCDLFNQYVDKVKEHLTLEDTHLYAPLLNHNDQSVNSTAKLFLSGSTEIKRIFERYLRKWCKNKVIVIKNHEEFVKETEEMLRLVQNRIIDETEHLYPLIRKVGGDDRMASRKTG